MTDNQPETNTAPKILTLTELHKRGWTDALVKRFLGEPDATKPNPHYRKAAPMRLYALARVEQAERREEWQRAKAKAFRRSEASRKVSTRKAAEVVMNSRMNGGSLQHPLGTL